MLFKILKSLNFYFIYIIILKNTKEATELSFPHLDESFYKSWIMSDNFPNGSWHTEETFNQTNKIILNFDRRLLAKEIYNKIHVQSSIYTPVQIPISTSFPMGYNHIVNDVSFQIYVPTLYQFSVSSLIPVPTIIHTIYPTPVQPQTFVSISLSTIESTIKTPSQCTIRTPDQVDINTSTNEEKESTFIQHPFRTDVQILDKTTVQASSLTQVPNTLEQKMYPRFRNCVNKELKPKYEQRGNYWVLQNYIAATRRFRCDESITYTSHGEFEFLDNLIPITFRWQGPVSIAVYAPGEDFHTSLKTILHLRNCVSKDVKELVTFHFIFDMKHFPDKIPKLHEIDQIEVDCGQNISFSNIVSYRQKMQLLYPINLARNIARLNAATYFNCPLDIELYPSVNIISEFFNMLRREDVSDTSRKRVYVLPAFEIEDDHKPPNTKHELLEMLHEKRAYVFHENICLKCHFVPEYKNWLEAIIDPELSVFHIGKRRLHYVWEPFYIGTEEEPLFDERLTWEGRGDKMSQAYIMCLLDYEFHTLDNAFLIHKPGIQLPNPNHKIDKRVIEQRNFIYYRLSSEYQKLYGKKDRKECQIMGTS